MYVIVMKANIRGSRWQVATSVLFSNQDKAMAHIAKMIVNQPGHEYKAVWLELI